MSLDLRAKTSLEQDIQALIEHVPGLYEGMTRYEAHKYILSRIIELETTIWYQQQLLDQHSISKEESTNIFSTEKNTLVLPLSLKQRFQRTFHGGE